MLQLSSVEDPTRPWSEDKYPWHEIAKVEFPAQELQPELDADRLEINPWNGLEVHRPIGGINRLRLDTYLQSILSRRNK